MRMSNEDYDLMLGCILENIVASPSNDAAAGNESAKKQQGKRKSKAKCK